MYTLARDWDFNCLREFLLSAWAPVFAGAVSAAAFAAAHVVLAVWSAPHVLTSASHMKPVMTSIFWADP